MAENIKSGKYYRVFNGTDWDRMHFVTDANSVDANDGDTMETKVGAIKGITTSTAVTEEGYAADATTVAALNSSLSNVVSDIYVGDDGKLHKVVGGADSVLPFSSDIITEPFTELTLIKSGGGSGHQSSSYEYTYTATKECNVLTHCASARSSYGAGTISTDGTILVSTKDVTNYSKNINIWICLIHLKEGQYVKTLCKPGSDAYTVHSMGMLLLN